MAKLQQQEPQGCLTILLKFIGLDLGSRASAEKERLPYRLRDDFLSAAELSFFRALQQSVKDELLICPKVNLGDLFYVPRSDKSLAYRNQIDRKHIDFLLTDPATMAPRLGVELDDSSHTQKQRQERDQFVDRVFEAAGLPLLHIPAAGAYSLLELGELIFQSLERNAKVPAPPVVVQSGTPVCPKCQQEMILRTAGKGARRGEKFWGCQNYPQCRETLPV